MIAGHSIACLTAIGFPGLKRRNEELEKVAEDLEAQVRALKQQLLHPNGSSQAVKSPQQVQQRRQILQLQAELDAVQYERDMEKSHIRRLEAIRHLEVRHLQMQVSLLVCHHQSQTLATLSFWTQYSLGWHTLSITTKLHECYSEEVYNLRKHSKTCRQVPLLGRTLVCRWRLRKWQVCEQPWHSTKGFCGHPRLGSSRSGSSSPEHRIWPFFR